MRRTPRRPAPALAFLALVALVAASAARAAEGSGGGQASDPCGFYRSQAYGRGIAHFATEMLWACEAIADRRRAAIELSERLRAAEAAIERYRLAVVEAGAAAYVRTRAERRASSVIGVDDAAKAALAESTGTLAALEAIRSGF